MARITLGEVAREYKVALKDASGLPVVGLEHLTSGEISLEHWDEGKETTFTKEFKKGQMLFGRRRAYLKKAALAPFDGVCSGDIIVIEAIPGRMNPDLLPFIIQNDLLFDYAVGNSAGSLSPRVKWESLKNYTFELPEMDKQDKLVRLLKSAHAVKKSYRKLLEATDALVKSQFIEMFGELGTDSKGWGLTTLGQCSILNPKRPRGIDDSTLVSFVPMPAVSENGKIDCSDVRPYSEVKKGYTYFAEKDVIFAKITPCMENGKGAVAEGLSNQIGSGSTEFHILRPVAGKTNPYWLYILTMFDSFRVGARKVMTGTGGQLRVPISYLEEFPISVPPIELQDEFELIVHQSDKSKFELQQAIQRVDNLIKSLISQE